MKPFREWNQTFHVAFQFHCPLQYQSSLESRITRRGILNGRVLKRLTKQASVRTPLDTSTLQSGESCIARVQYMNIGGGCRRRGREREGEGEGRRGREGEGGEGEGKGAGGERRQENHR